MIKEQNGGAARWTRLTAFVALGTFAFTVLSGMIYIVWWIFELDSGLKYQTQSQAMKNEEYDRRITQNNESARKLDLRLTAQGRDLNEIETQFCASDIVRNLMHAQDQRTMSLLWQKEYGTPIPTDNAYYPMICNRKEK